MTCEECARYHSWTESRPGNGGGEEMELCGVLEYDKGISKETAEKIEQFQRGELEECPCFFDSYNV